MKGYTRTCGAKHAGNTNNSSSNFAPENQEIKKDDDEGCFGDSGTVIYSKDKQNILNKYKSKKAQDLSKDEIDEFLRFYL